MDRVGYQQHGVLRTKNPAKLESDANRTGISLLDSMNVARPKPASRIRSHVSKDSCIRLRIQLGAAENGLIGHYFKGVNFDEPAFTQTDGEINFFWDENSPDDRLPADNFSIRWTGQIMANQSGKHTSSTTADDGTRLWIDGKLIISDWTEHFTQTSSGAIRLEKGSFAEVDLSWKTGTKEVKLPEPATVELTTQSKGLLGQYFGNPALQGDAAER